jgi:hypothetical protein
MGFYFPSLMQRIPGGLYDEELKVLVNDIESQEAFKRGRAVDRQDKGGAGGLLTHTVVEGSKEVRYLLCRSLDTLISRLLS